MSHRHFTAQLGQFGGCSGHSGQTPTGTALAIINTTYRWGRAYSEGSDFRRRERKVLRVDAAATSSVRSFQSLTLLGGEWEFSVICRAFQFSNFWRVRDARLCVNESPVCRCGLLLWTSTASRSASIYIYTADGVPAPVVDSVSAVIW